MAGLLSLPVESVVVDRSSDGAPIWPQGVIGSITHTRELAAAVAMRGSDALGIGLDAEPFMARPRAVAISRVIATSSELAPLAAATGLGQAEILTMVFSAKEATFKCLHPLARRMFDFREASIDDIDLRTGRFILRLLVTLTSAFTCGQQFHGRIAIQGSCVFTSMHLATVADATDDGLTLSGTR